MSRPLQLPRDFVVNPQWAELPLFDRSGWKRLPFGQFAESVNVRVEPSEAADEPYVGLEHLESGSLRIRSWGKGSDVIGTKLRFRKGDVIFGRRRAYQRKLAVAEMDGICSAHAMVVRAKPDRVLPEFLPFLMISDGFMTRAVEISVGSLSPTINWTTLKTEEFVLPPLGQQRRISDVVAAAYSAAESARRLARALRSSRDHWFESRLQRAKAFAPDSISTLGRALRGIAAGKSPKAASRSARDSEFGVLKVSAVGDGVFVQEENKALLDDGDFDGTTEVQPGMVLVTRCNASVAGLARACYVESTRPGLMLSDKTLRLQLDESAIDMTFLLQGLRSKLFRDFIERSANGTEAKNISQETLRAAPFWVPALGAQGDISSRLREFSDCADLAERESNAALKLLGALLATSVHEAVR